MPMDLPAAKRGDLAQFDGVAWRALSGWANGQFPQFSSATGLLVPHTLSLTDIATITGLTVGDLLYANDSAQLARLPISGGTGYLLEFQLDGAMNAVPTWTNPFGGVATTSAVGDTATQGAGTGVFATAKHVHGREAFAAPTTEQTVGSAAATGTATTLPHSDHAHGNPTAASIGTALFPALTAYTPTVSAAGGTITSYTVTARYIQVGKMLFVECIIIVTNAGTGVGNLQFTLPNSLLGASRQFIPGAEEDVVGSMIWCRVVTGSNIASCAIYNNGSPVVTNYHVTVSGWVEVQ